VREAGKCFGRCLLVVPAFLDGVVDLLFPVDVTRSGCMFAICVCSEMEMTAHGLRWTWLMAGWREHGHRYTASVFAYANVFA
jgi:hypothetical protein